MSRSNIDVARTIVHGVLFDPKNDEKVAQMDLSDLFASVHRLFDLLHEREVDYVVVGGVAMLAYVDGRNTQDIDLILSRDGVARLPEIVIESESPNFLRGRLDNLQIDVLLTDNGLFAEIAKQYATTQKFAQREVRCVSPEGLVLLKLFALPSLYRRGQLAKMRIYEGDVEALIDSHDVAAEELLPNLRPYLSASDIVALERIVADLRSRLKASEGRFKDAT